MTGVDDRPMATVVVGALEAVMSATAAIGVLVSAHRLLNVALARDPADAEALRQALAMHSEMIDAAERNVAEAFASIDRALNEADRASDD